MKKMIMLSFAAVALGFAACNNVASENTTETDSMSVSAGENSASGDYTELESGQPVDLVKDEETGYLVNAATGEPVEFYVSMSTMDTFYGRTGTVVNNAILQNEVGSYELDEAKIKWDEDEMKVIGADGSKEKMEDGEYKYKGADGSKIKADDDELKIKQDGIKMKVEDGETKVKRDD